MKKEPILYSQIIPLGVAVASLVFFAIILIVNLKFSNFIFSKNPISLIVRFGDLLLGVYLYLKTSIDFAVFTGSMMSSNPGWKNRIAVEWGTSLGNFVGTLLIIWAWSFFRSTSPVLEGIIVIIASFVLLELAAGSLNRLHSARWEHAGFLRRIFYRISELLLKIRFITEPFLIWMPDVGGSMAGKKAPNMKALLLYSFTIPFVLGSDDFAGYISVFNVVNIFSFAIGVLLGHTILLAGLFASPGRVQKLLAKPIFSALAVTTFFIIFGVGFLEGSGLLISWGKNNMLVFAIALSVAVVYAITHHLRKFGKSGWEKTREKALEILNQEVRI